jgi:hypothetical protein
MRAVLILLTLAGTLVTPGMAIAARQRTVRPIIIDDSLVITIGSPEGGAEGAYVDLGVATAVTPNRHRGASVTAARILSVRVDRPSGMTGNGVTLKAWLRSVDANISVRINGIELGSTPRIIDPQMKIGRSIAIRIEAAVPSTAPEGMRLSAIEWEASTN